MKTILTVVGARPQFVKAAVVSRVLKQNTNIKEIIVHTGQHYDVNMSDVFFDEMKIPSPDYHLAVGGGSHGAMTGQMLAKIEEVLVQEKPDAVLVYGDTNSTLAGALAAVKLHIPVAHVEAGLRSFNRKMPEEINRVLTDQVSEWLFCPSSPSKENLLAEGIGSEKIFIVGDVMCDATLYYSEIAQPTPQIRSLVDQNPKYYLSTIHRAENTDDPTRLKGIFNALCKISERVPVILPLHPRTKKKVQELDVDLAGISVIEPVGYFDMISLLKRAKGVLTDSGGLQKEAYFFRKPCITLRDETEWVETVEVGANQLAGAREEKILEAWGRIDTSHPEFQAGVYGAGDAGEKIVGELTELI